MLNVVFKREKDLEVLLKCRKNGKIKIIAGLRRAGKSYLLDLFKDYLMKKEGCSEKAIKIEDFSKQERIKTDDDLKEYLNGLTKNKELRYICLDEVQESAEHFAEIVLKFHKLHPEYQIYITGSNSKILSDDIVKYFKDDGDPIFIETLPYSDIIAELPSFTLDDYFKVGGLPTVLIQGDESERIRELSQLSKKPIHDGYRG